MNKPFIPDLLRRTKQLIRKALPVQYKRLYNLAGSQHASSHSTKKALLSYIVHPFSIDESDPRFLGHINIWHAREMVTILNELGYVVDVIDYRDTGFVPRQQYDLFIGHGGINYAKIARKLPVSATKIYFSTGSYWKYHNHQELGRFEALRKRRGVALLPDRLIHNSEEEALQMSDAIIGIGGTFTAQTYEGFTPVIMINNTALADDHYNQQHKDYAQARNHFFFFAGSGNVHKGLDLLLEVFPLLPEQHLWIATHVEPKFAHVYAHVLDTCPNVHVCGFVQPHTDLYYELIDRCAFTILPSCSEGQPGSIVECINQGLIPVVSRQCGLDVDDFGIILETCGIAELTCTVKQLAGMPTDICQKLARHSREAAKTLYSEAAFYHSFRAALEGLLADG